MREFYLILVALLLVFYVKWIKLKAYKNKKPIGDLGENRVKRELEKLPADFLIRNDVHILGSQIDHMVFYQRQIYVIETKLWKCPIKGSYSEKNWTSGGRLLYNPILQNKKHCSNVKKAYPFFNITSIVVFAGGSNFPHLKGVIHVSELVQYIKSLSV